MSRRVLVMLGMLVSLLAALEFAQAALPSTGYPVWQRVMVMTGSLGMVACWFGWRRSGARWMLLVFFAATFAATGGDGSGLGVLSMVLGVGMVAWAYGASLGLGLVAVLALAMELVRVLAGVVRPVAALGDAVGTFLVLGLGVPVGQLLRELDRERRRNAELVEQVRRTAGVEQELMLADERARSARELHDGLGHQLTLVVLGLEYAERMADRDPARALAEVAQAREAAAGALTHMRRWVRALNPPREQAVTGNAAFESIAGSFRGTGLDVEVTHTGTERELGRASSLVALRMVQEGLTNVVRHSSADRVGLHLDWGDDLLQLSLRDNGGPAQALVPGFGLRSLAERAREIGGRFEARSTGEGVELCGAVPTGAR